MYALGRQGVRAPGCQVVRASVTTSIHLVFTGINVHGTEAAHHMPNQHKPRSILIEK